MREQKKARFIHTGKNIATKFQQTKEKEYENRKQEYV